MNKYLISYDLIKVKDYEKLFEAIKSYGTYCKVLRSVWIIKSNNSSKEIGDHISQFMDSDDKLVVFSLNGEGAWRNLSGEITMWLKNSL